MIPIALPRLDNAACIGRAPSDRLCRGCWDRPECLTWALEHATDGFYAGRTAPELRLIRTEFGIGLRPFGSVS